MKAPRGPFPGQEWDDIAEDIGFRVLGSWGLGFRVLGFGVSALGVWGLGFRGLEFSDVDPYIRLLLLFL